MGFDMSIKYRYRLFNRIAIIGSVILGTVIACLNNQIELKMILIWILLLMGSSILVLDYKKLKAIDRKFGAFKVRGDNWLGADGDWHGGYYEIISSRMQDYYDKGGEDLGYTFGRIMCMMTFAFCIVPLGNFTGLENDYGMGIFAVVFWIYVIIRKAIIG